MKSYSITSPKKYGLVFQIPETLPICGTVRRMYQIQDEFYSKYKLHLESYFLHLAAMRKGHGLEMASRVALQRLTFVIKFLKSATQRQIWQLWH